MHNTIQEFLDNETLISDFFKNQKTRYILNHSNINKLSAIVTNKDYLQRLYVFVNDIIINRSYQILSPYWEKNNKSIYYAELHIASSYVRHIFTQDPKVQEYLFKVLEDLDICKYARSIETGFNFKRQSKIYTFNMDIVNTLEKVPVIIDCPKVVNSINNYYMSKWDGISPEHKRLLNNNIIKVWVDITKEQFHAEYYLPELEIHKTCEIKKIGNKKLRTREEFLEDFEKYVKAIWAQIERINSENKYLRFLNCKPRDEFGHRFYHPFINLPKSLRKYMRMDTKQVIRSSVEIDMTAAQPTLCGIEMQKAGLIDEAFFSDLNTEDFYTTFGLKIDQNMSRDDVKGFMMHALYGQIDNSYFTNNDFIKLSTIYPVLGEYLTTLKRRTFSEIKEKHNDIKKEIPSYVSNCKDMQIAETNWANLVWGELMKLKIRFVPIHDSVLIFTKSDISLEELNTLGERVQVIMYKHLNLPENSLITPKFKIKII